MFFRTFVLLLALAAVARADVAPRLELLSPEGKPPYVVTRDRVHIAVRTEPGARATVGGLACPVYTTGIFVRDGVPLQMGQNFVRIAVTFAGRTAELPLQIRRDAPPPPKVTPRSPLAIDADTIKPDKDLALLPGDELEVGFRGTPGHLAEYRLDSGPWQRLLEDSDKDSPAGNGRYRATVVTTHTAEMPPTAVEVRLSPEKPGEPAQRGEATGAGRSPASVPGSPGEGTTSGSAQRSGEPGEPVVPVQMSAKGKVTRWSSAVVRQAVVSRDIGTDLVWGLHEVRLGGPAVGRMPQGTVLRITGQRGGSYRVRLTPQLEAWAEAEHVKLLPPGTPVQRLTFTNIKTRSEIGADRVEIPWDARIPFAITPSMSVTGRPALDIELYGAQHGATWITHPRSLAVVNEVHVEQRATDHVRVRVELNTTRLWGWKVDTATGGLVVTVRGAPHIADAASPLKGFPIVIEAGHGGSNEGAAGLMKVFEKDITLKIADLLAAELTAAGAKVSKIRQSDELISMEDRAKRAMKSDAKLFVSIHCNSADTGGGFLRVGGTSTFYKHATARDLARLVVGAMLADTGLPDYGSIGNFNYYPIRALTWMPAMLVETAFLSNPFEEAKLLDPAGQKTIAHAIRRGVEEFLRQVASGH